MISLVGVFREAGIKLPSHFMCEKPGCTRFGSFITITGKVVSFDIFSIARLQAAYRRLVVIENARVARTERRAAFMALSVRERSAIVRSKKSAARAKVYASLEKKKKQAAFEKRVSLLKKKQDAVRILRQLEREPTRCQVAVAKAYWKKLEASLPKPATESQIILARYRAWRNKQARKQERAQAELKREATSIEEKKSASAPTAVGRSYMVGLERATPSGVAFNTILEVVSRCAPEVEALEVSQRIHEGLPVVTQKLYADFAVAIRPMVPIVYGMEYFEALAANRFTAENDVILLIAQVANEAREFSMFDEGKSEAYGFISSLKTLADCTRAYFNPEAIDMDVIMQDAAMEEPLMSKLKAAAGAACNYAGSMVSIGFGKVKNKIWDFFLGMFEKTVGVHLKKLGATWQIFKGYMEKAREWVETAITKCNDAIASIKNHVFTILCLIVLGGLVNLAEGALFTLGVVPYKGIAMGVFFSLSLAFFGVNYLAKQEGPRGPFFELCSHFRTLLGKCFTEAAEGDLAPGRSVAYADIHSPITFLNWFGSSLMSVNTGTITYFGKLGNACEGIRKGINCVRDAASFAIASLAEIYASVTGKDLEFFREISLLTKIDLKAWIGKVERALLELEIMKIRDRGMLEALTHLIADGYTLRSAAMEHEGRNSHLGSNYLRITTELLRKLEEKRKEVARGGTSIGRRVEPFWLYIYGPSHCGKSNVMNYMAAQLLDELELPPTDCLTLTPTDKYMSGYERQSCIKIDDLSCVRLNEAGIEEELINLISCQDYRPVMADCSDKGMLFDSPLIISSSNHWSAPTGAKFTCRDAYNNRRAMVLECRRATEEDGVPMVEGDPMTTVMCRAMQHNVEAPREGNFSGEWKQACTMMGNVKDELQKHMRNQKIFMDTYKRSVQNKHPLMSDAECVLVQQNRFSMLSLLPNQYTGEGAAIACDGKAACFRLMADECKECVASGVHCKLSNGAPVYKGHLLKSMGPENCRDLESKYLESYRRMDPHGKSTFYMAGPIVESFLRSMLQKDVRVVDATKDLEGFVTPAQKDFWDQLPWAERFYMRLQQKRIDEISALPKKALGEYLPKCLEALRNTGNWLWSNGGKIFVLLVALILVYAFAQTFLALFSLFTFGKSGVETVARFDAYSVFASSSIDAQSYKARNIPLNPRSHVYSNGGAGDVKEYPLDLICTLELSSGQLISCIRGRHRSLYLTVHQADSIPLKSKCKLSYYEKDGTHSSFSIIWDPSIRVVGGTRYGLFKYSDTEAAMYSCPTLSPLPSTRESYFLNDYEAKMPKYLSLKFAVVKQKRFGHASHMTNVPDDMGVLHYWNGDGTVIHEKHVIERYNDSARVYTNELPRTIATYSPTGPEDCGCVVTARFKIGGQDRDVVVGMVVGGNPHIKNPKQGANTTISFLPPLAVSEAYSSIAYVAEIGDATEGYCKLGHLKRDKQPHLPTKTAYVEVPEDLKIPRVVSKVPAILAKGDERLRGSAHENFDPVRTAPTKYANPMELLPQKLVEETMGDMVSSWRQYKLNPLQKVDMRVAINGIEGEEYFDKMVENTSEGYPHVLNRSPGETGKSRFLEMDPSDESGLFKRLIPGCAVDVNLKRMMDVAKGDIPELICMDVPKDELLPLRKVFQQPKTRFFSICPFEYNLLLRCYTLAFVAFLQRHRHTLPSQVGIVPQSKDWDGLYARMKAMNASEGYNCDYSGFDGYLNHQILSVIAAAFNSMFDDEDEIDSNIRYNLIMALVNRKVIVGSQLYEVRAGLPSGLALTVTLNSIFNELLVRMAFKQMAPPLERTSFEQNIFLAVYGDDNIITVNPGCSYFSGTEMKKIMAQWGVIITDGKDKTSLQLLPRPIEDLDFLKRSFHPQNPNENDGLGVVAPLNEDAIYSSLHYYKAEGSSLDNLIASVRSSLLELRLWKDRKQFDALRDFYINNRPALDLVNVLPTWEKTTDIHMELKASTLPYKPYRVLDFELDTKSLSRSLTQLGGSDWCYAICPRLCVAGNRHKTAGNSFAVWCGVPAQKGVDGVQIPITYSAYGTGRQPTREWAKRFRSPIGPMSKIRDAYKQEKTIVFLSEGPYIASWLALINFASAYCGHDRAVLLQVYRESKTTGSANLSYYFEDVDFEKRNRKFKGLDTFLLKKGFLDERKD